MLVKTEWQQAGRIILQLYAGDVSLADMEEGLQAVTDLIDTAEKRLPIHLILDLSQRQTYDPELFKLPTMRRLFELSNHVAWLIAIQPAPNPIMLFTTTLAARLTGHKFRIVGSLEDALRHLHFSDTSLIELPDKP